jgi:phosphoribosyl-AMP cyclohydrolase
MTQHPVDIDALRYDAAGLIPAVVQQHDTGEVLMVAWMNRTAVERTLQGPHAWFYSRSRQQLGEKGATSGNVQTVVSVTVDCDADTLLVQVDQHGVACHTGTRSCFTRALPTMGSSA